MAGTGTGIRNSETTGARYAVDALSSAVAVGLRGHAENIIPISRLVQMEPRASP